MVDCGLKELGFNPDGTLREAASQEQIKVVSTKGFQMGMLHLLRNVNTLILLVYQMQLDRCQSVSNVQFSDVDRKLTFTVTYLSEVLTVKL